MQPRIVGLLPQLSRNDALRRIVGGRLHVTALQQSIDLGLQLNPGEELELVFDDLPSRRGQSQSRVVPAIQDVEPDPSQEEPRLVDDPDFRGLVHDLPRLLRAPVPAHV